MPRSASETLITSDSLFTGGAGWLALEFRELRSLGIIGRPASVEAGDAFWLLAALPFFSSSFCDSCTIASSAVFMSCALAFLTCRTNTFSRTGVAMSIERAISSMRFMFCSVSVTRMEFVRSKTSRMPLLDLKPSSAFCASSVPMFLKGIIIETTRPVSPSFVSGSMMSGMPSLRTSFLGSARMKRSPYGSRWMPFISRTTSIASRYSSFVSFWPSRVLSVIVGVGAAGSLRIVLSICSA